MSRKRWVPLALAAVAALAAAELHYLWPLLPAEWVGRPVGPATRPAEWATPLSLPGVGNFHKVSDELFRGAQPTEEGMRQLKALGIRTIINLRSVHSDRDEIAQTDLTYEHINTKPWHPEDADVVRFLRIVSDKSRAPFFVHCQRGADRTGLMCAIYRMAVQGWPREQAIEEMTQGGYGFAPGWKDLVEYLRNADLAKLKQQAGLAP